MIIRIQYPDNIDAAFTQFRGLLTQNGFATHSENADSVVGTCPVMMRKAGNPLENAAPIKLVSRNKGLELEGAFARIRTRTYFSLGLGLSVGLIVVIRFGKVALAGNMSFFVMTVPMLLGASLAYTFMCWWIIRLNRDRATLALAVLAKRLANASGGTVSTPPSELPPDRPAEPLIRRTVFFGLGLLVFLLDLPSGAGNMLDDANRLVLPSQHVMRLTRHGHYTVFYEYHANLDGKTYDSPESWSGIKLVVRAADTGEVVPIQPATGRSRYAQPERSGYAVAQFNAPHGGDYQLTGKGIPANETRVVSIARYDATRVFWPYAKILVVLALGVNWLFYVLGYFRSQQQKVIAVDSLA